MSDIPPVPQQELKAVNWGTVGRSVLIGVGAGVFSYLASVKSIRQTIEASNYHFAKKWPGYVKMIREG